MASNLCEGGVSLQLASRKQHSCPLLPPAGLQVTIQGQMVAVAPGDDITLVVHQEQVGGTLFPVVCSFSSVSSRQGDTSGTRYQVELGDGVRAIYQNLTVADEPVQHRYQKPGIYKVTVKAENAAGHDQATVYIQVTGERCEVPPEPPAGPADSSFPGPGKGRVSCLLALLQEVHLEVLPVVGRNQEVNLSAVVLPADANRTVFYWWIGDELQVSCVCCTPASSRLVLTRHPSCSRP